MIIDIIILPRNVDQEAEQRDLPNESEQVLKEKVSTRELWKIGGFFWGVITIILLNSVVSSLLVILPTRYEDYDVDEDYASIVLLAYYVPMSCSGLIAPSLVAKYGRLCIFVLSSLVASTACLLIGPSSIFGLDENLTLMMCGHVFLGISTGLWTVQTFPLM